MKRIAQIENNEIINVSIADDNWVTPQGYMLESDAIAIGYQYKQKDILIPGYHVQPENFYLSDENTDETEFNKLITLCKLAIEQNLMNILDTVKIKDINGNVHSITIQRFLEIMVMYGMHCYNNRSY